MHPLHLLGGGVLVAALGWFATTSFLTDAPATPPAPPVADGHYVLIVQGDRDQLAIVHARAKADPWAGVPKGLRSDWLLRIHAADRTLLAEVPLDLAAFDLSPERKGGAVAVEGCIVRDPRVTALVNAPRFAAAADYTFVRRDATGDVLLGVVAGDQVRELAGGRR
jgi:hypothetical protein